MKKPNIFNYATSELSQDAFITWLIQWASIEYMSTDKDIHNCASVFVKSLIGESQEYKITSIESGRQWNNIDIWAKVNDDYFIVIEDKKGTKEHSDQLKRYAEIANETYSKSDIKIILVYFKMEEQGRYSAIEDAGYIYFSRERMLSVLEPYFLDTKNKHGNNILLDYYTYLKDLDEKINSFKTLPLEQWNWYSWKGFFTTLKKDIDGDWDYIANASGGFLGFWWHRNSKKIENEGFNFYLQLEYNKLVFKLESYKPEYRRKLRDYYRSKLYPKAIEMGIEIHQFGRIGRWMGVARLNKDYRQTNKTGLIDLQGTIDTLRQMENLINETRKEMTE